MAWTCLILAGLLEIVWAVGLKYTQGFTRLGPSVLTVAAMALSFALMSLALREIPMGTAYAVWTGLGAAGTVLFGIIILGESRDLLRIFCLALIIGGVVGLKVSSSDETKAAATAAPAAHKDK